VSVTWDDLRGGLPEHGEEIMASHEGRPTIETQDKTHGAPCPDEDRGDGTTGFPARLGGP
jgi:hypothetical protein